MGGNSLVLTARETNTSISLVASPTTTVYGQSPAFTFTATLSSEAGAGALPTGAAIFFEVFAGNTPTGTPIVSELVPVNASGVAVYNPQLDANSVFNAGQYFVRASYAGTATFAASTASTLYTIGKGNTNFQMTPNNANLVVGENLSVTVTISPRTPAGQLGGSLLPSGNVTLRVNGVVLSGGPFSLDSEGKATISVGTLPVGTHTIDVTYNGDTNYNTVASTPASRLVVTVRKANAQFSVSPSVPSATFGEPVTFTATLNPVAPATAIPTGTVTFRRGSATGVILGTATLDANGIATLTVSNLPVGNQTVFAVWPGDANFVAPAAVSTSVVINRVGTTTTLSSSANPSNPGASVQLRADIVAANGATPSGSVRFVNADTNAVLGTAAVNAPGRAVLNVTLPVGTYNIRAEYLGNANLAPSSATLTQVSAWGSRTTLASSQNPSIPGSQVTITATVAKAAGVPASVANPVGTVEFYNDSVNPTVPAFTATLNPSGQAAWVTNALPNGANTIRVVFVPSNATYATSTATLVQNVVFNSTTTVTAANNPIVTGQANTFTATVSGSQGTPTGIVEFRVGTTVLGQASLDASGQATFTTSALVASTAPVTVTAVYLGSNTYAGSQAGVNVTVNRANTTVGLTSNGPSTGAGQPAIFTATVQAVAPGSGIPAGTVTFTATPISGTPRTATVSLNASGQAVWSVSNLPQGSYTITAVYNGSPAYNGSANTIGIGHTVLAAATVSLTTSGNPVLPTSNITLTTTVTGTAANGRPSGSVIFTINGVDQPPVSLVNGANALQSVATLTLPAGSLPLGTTPITARYSGDAVYGGQVSSTLNQAVRGNTSVSLSSSNPSVPVRTPVTLTATITQIAAPSGSPAPTGTVTFRDGTTVIGTATVSTVGGVTTASLTVNNLPVGARSITATYNGDSNNLSSVSPAFVQNIIPVVANIVLQPSSTRVTLNSPMSLRVTAFGPDNNVATTFNGTGSFTVVSAPVGGVVNGSRTTTFTNGVGTFAGLSFTRIGNYTLRVVVDGIVRTIVISVTGGGRV
ncbi:MAG: Ig-like domain-containing protein [Gemmataceae bacterium]